ncbi:MAG: hypothetical protein WC437_04835 [Patescibacteria group bacterium]|jgi:ribosomal protein L40E
MAVNKKKSLMDQYDYDETDLEDDLKAACFDDDYCCRKCGNPMEPDAERCGECGAKMPLRSLGFI